MPQFPQLQLLTHPLMSLAVSRLHMVMSSMGAILLPPSATLVPKGEQAMHVTLRRRVQGYDVAS